jgi:hypothetical protein
MKRFVFVFLLLFVVFSGCLIQPQVTIKKVNDSGEKVLVELYSNKQLNASVKLKNQSGTVLCEVNVLLNQGNTSVPIPCNLTDSFVEVEVFAEGAVFSNEVEVEFGGESVDSKIMQLAESTLEGQTLALFKRNLDKSKECNSGLFVSTMKNYVDYMEQIQPGSSSSLGIDFDNISSEQRILLQQKIDELNSCNININHKINFKSDRKYDVVYDVVVSENCGTTAPSGEKEAIIIEIDLKNNSAETTKGLMSNNSTEEQQSQLIQAYDLMGSCMKYFLLGVTNVLVNNPNPSVNPPSQEIESVEGQGEIEQNTQIEAVEIVSDNELDLNMHIADGNSDFNSSN